MSTLRDSTVFCGCSYTSGVGLDLEDADPGLWVNILHQSIPQLSNTKLINVGKGGATNEDIFLSALDNITNNQKCKNLFVAFTAFKRLWINPSVETYDTKIYLENTKIIDLNINPGVVILGSYVENIRDRFFDLTHSHYDILKIFQYSSLLNQIANQLGVNVFFINSLMWVDKNYFVPIISPSRLPSDTTLLTQKLLNASTRDDKEYFEIYDKIHLDYKNTGALSHNWLNLDQGFRTTFYLDKGNDQLHPGIKSNQAFANFLIKKITNKQQQA
jgi:hypothetical protein